MDTNLKLIQYFKNVSKFNKIKGKKEVVSAVITRQEVPYYIQILCTQLIIVNCVGCQEHHQIQHYAEPAHFQFELLAESGPFATHEGIL